MKEAGERLENETLRSVKAVEKVMSSNPAALGRPSDSVADNEVAQVSIR